MWRAAADCARGPARAVTAPTGIVPITLLMTADGHCATGGERQCSSYSADRLLQRSLPATLAALADCARGPWAGAQLQVFVQNRVTQAMRVSDEAQASSLFYVMKVARPP